MLFPTITFAVFFTIVLGLHALLQRRPTAWRVTMLAASYVFYAWWDWRFLSLIMISTTVDFIVGRRLEASSDTRTRRGLLSVSLTVNLAMLGFFKYADFFVESLVDALDSIGVSGTAEPLGILLPVGISFYTFQTLSYTIDIYRGEMRASRSLLDFALFVAFFPQLVAGPIVRAKDFLAQLATNDRAPIDHGRAMGLILGGLAKKVILADLLASELVDPVFNNPEAATGFETMLATYGYAVQIYADFSGYSDIAIGCALLLGFRFPQNFDQPYRSATLQEFWRRWHISLSSWLRDYLYISLGGNRRGDRRTYVNLMVTMLLGGLWHGAGWNFVIWGAIHGGGLAIERRITDVRGTDAAPSAGRQVLRTIATFHIVCAAWIFFRAATFDQALDVFGALGNSWLDAGGVSFGVVLAILVGLSVQYLPKEAFGPVAARVTSLPVIAQGVGFALAITMIDVLGPDGVAPFIYFQF